MLRPHNQLSCRHSGLDGSQQQLPFSSRRPTLDRPNTFAAYGRNSQGSECDSSSAIGNSNRTPSAGNTGTATTWGRNLLENLGLVSATLVADDNVVEAQPLEEELAPPDLDVERIVRRMETLNESRIPVPLEVKTRFLRMCDAACRRRMEQQETEEEQHGNRQ
jgi:hypothetical protein